ncbi:MAG: VCBS repeat-containing protein [Candidatus Accumulibacter sp.]|uniref:VCBS repeat-containing protein n=1 Tax=Accumulibacter sp. TaxID=2053492 RepID=UPI002878CB52|nr:VCBS repeat-containing protein [Accumulibacter sp.]MDS4015917.1 VCBS repeat-containing protein [Accumulibacter sp.]
MRITGTTLQVDADAFRMEQRAVNESLTVRAGAARAFGEARGEAPPIAATVDLSPAGQAAQASEARALEESLDAVENDPMLRLIRALLGWLTGREVKVFDAAELNAAVASDAGAADAAGPSEPRARPVMAGAALAYSRQESYTEVEQLAVEASGVVRTSDGREISFSLSLQMSRSYHAESSFSLRAGDAPRTKDPLVLNFAGSSAQLTDRRFAFDLDADGANEAIHLATRGSGFLALDRNGDGRVNNGLELFGARSGDGFAELATLDGDGNGWIDSADAAYEGLRVWSRSETGEDRMTSLAAAGIGALSVHGASSPFALKTSDNALQGLVRSTGLYLREDGAAGSLQQVDLAV